MISSYLDEFILSEWEQNRREFPDQPWTAEWIDQLDRRNFRLKKIPLDRIILRKDLMSYNTPQDCFARSLETRADEMQQSFSRGVSFEPLLVNGETTELMDGYTRYTVLKREGVSRVLAYQGTSRVPGRKGKNKNLEALKRRAGALKREITAIYYAFRNPETPRGPKIVIWITLFSALSPIDLIPDFIPVLGYLDDLILIPALLAWSIRLIPDEIMEKSRKTGGGRTTEAQPQITEEEKSDPSLMFQVPVPALNHNGAVILSLSHILSNLRQALLTPLEELVIIQIQFMGSLQPRARKLVERLLIKAGLGLILPISIISSAVNPVSSRSSRTAASRAVSPGSTTPAGNSQERAPLPWRNCRTIRKEGSPSPSAGCISGITVTQSGDWQTIMGCSLPSGALRSTWSIENIGPLQTSFTLPQSFHIRFLSLICSLSSHLLQISRFLSSRG